jgi:hypothetical protein
MGVLITFCLAALVSLPTPPVSAPVSNTRLAALVRKLGDKSYRHRESAARELLRLGSASVAALTEGAKDADPEVGERCRQLLPQAAALERNEKLALLTKDPSAPPPKGLAGLERFLKVTGDDKGARELYAEMLSIHYRTIEAAETNPRDAAEQYRLFCDDAYNRWQVNMRNGRYSYDNMFSGRAEIAFFLFVSADTRVRKNDMDVSRSSIFLNGNQISTAINGKEPVNAAMRKLFLDWLEHEPQTYLQQRGLQLAAQANMKEALPIVVRMLAKQDKNNSYAKAQAMPFLVKLGSKEHIKLLEPYLSDTSQLTSINFGDGRMFTVQVRDVAMGVQLQLAGQNMLDYGFDNRFKGNWLYYHYYGFPAEPEGKESKAREDAHAKWKEWAKKNLTGEEKKGPESKTPEPKGPEKSKTPESKGPEKK